MVYKLLLIVVGGLQVVTNCGSWFTSCYLLWLVVYKLFNCVVVKSMHEAQTAVIKTYKTQDDLKRCVIV